MNVLNQCFVFLELLVQFLSVGTYTVVLKQVKPLYPPLKIYRYELHPKILLGGSTYIYQKPLAQRIYPVATKPGRDGNYKTRVPVKKEKGKHQKVSSTTEKLSSGRLPGLSQHLIPPLTNQIEEYPEAKEEENDIRPLVASADTGKSFSSFEQQKGRIYNNPGEWATPVPQADSENSTKAEFTPSQLYLQIRHKNSVIHVPQSEALKDAETLEELINAPRLKQLSRTTHVQETYSEEGYEDAGYDHAGHLRQAQHDEIYNTKDEGVFKIKEPPITLDYDSDLEESKGRSTEKTKEPVVFEGNLTNKLEPRITRSRSETSKTSMEYTKIPKNYKGDHKYSSRVKTLMKTTDENHPGFNLTKTHELENVPPTFPSYFGEIPLTTENTFTNEPVLLLAPPAKISSKYRKGDLNSTKIFGVPESEANLSHQVNEYTDFKPYLSMIDSQGSPSTKSLKYSRIYSKKTKQLRLEPYKNENTYSPPPLLTPTTVVLPPYPNFQTSHQPEKMVEEEPINERIVLPTIGYINSLTTAHFAKGKTKQVQDDPKIQLTDPLNLTQAFNYLRLNKNQKNAEVTKAPTELDIRTFEPMRIKKSRNGFVGKTKRDVYLMREGERRSVDGIPKIQDIWKEDYEGNDESDVPHNEKNEEIAKDEKEKIEEEKREKEKYELDLSEEISNREKEIIKETYENIGIKEDFSEVFPEFPSSSSESDASFIPVVTIPASIDVKKYPFYKSKRLPENSPLRYATDPRQFPKKSGYKMEFYESREGLIQCPNLHQELENLPDSNSTEYSDEQAGNQRLMGLGDKILCLRMKYFDPEPFDNPIFKETEIDYVGKPVKGGKKIKIAPKTLRISTDHNSQQAHYRNSYAAKLVNPNQNAQLSFISGAVKQNDTYQPINVQLSSLHSRNTTPRIKPVTKTVNELPPQQISTYQNNQKRPVIGWKTTYLSAHSPRLHTQASEIRKQIIKPPKCLFNIRKTPSLNGTRNVTIDCYNPSMYQEVVNNVQGFQIIPNETKKQAKFTHRKWSEKILKQLQDQTDWIPIPGYTLPKHSDRASRTFGRKTDEVSEIKNNTMQNSTAVYAIDELKEDLKVRKGEVVEDMDHYMEMMSGLEDEMTETTTVKTENSTRRKRDAQVIAVEIQKQSDFEKILEPNFNSKSSEKTLTKSEIKKPVDVTKPRLFEQKRPLARLRGLDFLTRYYKNKGKPTTQKTEDFWKITTAEPIISKHSQKPQKKNAGRERNQEKVDRTFPHQMTEATSKNSEIKEESELKKNPKNKPVERSKKSEIKPTTERRKISLLNLIPEKITKKPEVKASDFWKSFSQPTEKIIPKSVNVTKTITKVRKETSESIENPLIGYKKSNANQSSVQENQTAKKTSRTLEVPQYKTINRRLTNNDLQNSSRPTETPEEPILYYVVNLKTGRGKWITNYDEQTIYRKPQKLKDGLNAKTNKRRKKPKL